MSKSSARVYYDESLTTWNSEPNKKRPDNYKPRVVTENLRIADDRLFKIASHLIEKAKFKLFSNLIEGDLFSLIYQTQEENRQLQTVLAINRYLGLKQS